MTDPETLENPAAPPPRRASQRLTALDAARGFAMLGVCLSHFGLGIAKHEPGLAFDLWRMGMIASPTFILLSGAVLGYLVALRRADPGPLRIALTDRAIFLLTVAHLLIDGAHLGRVHGMTNLLHSLFMTDTIAVSLVAGLLLVPLTAPRQRLVLAGALYVAGWAAVLYWHPVSEAAQLFKDVVFGSTNQYTEIRQNFPVIPWFSVYLAATVLGESIAEAREGGSLMAIGRWLLWTGPKWIVGAMAVKGVYLLARPTMWANYDAMPPMWRDLYDLTTPFDKYPPGPTYLLAYGGLALMLIGLVVVASERSWAPRLLESAAVVGRASLLVFVLQFYLYYVLIPLLPSNPRWLLLPYFVGSVGLLWVAARSWGGIRGNRFFTVGLTALAERRGVIETGSSPA